MTDTNPSTYSSPARYKWSFIFKVLTPVLIFWGFQLLAQVVAITGDVVIHLVKEGAGTGEMMQWIMDDSIGISVATLLLSSLLTIAILAKMGVGIKRSQWTLPTGRELLGYLAAFIGTVIWGEFILSWFDLPDWNMELMSGLMQNPLGVFSICLLGPVAEEFVFRGGVTERLLNNKVKPSVAIGLSGLVFGLIHVNPPQVIGAGILGLLLAYSYYKTRSLWIPVILHVVNNSMVVSTTLIYGQKTDSLLTVVSNESGTMGYAVLLLTATLIGCGGLYLVRSSSK